jgi:hypothetical protein
MACQNCKQKKEIIGEEKFQKTSDLVERWIPWFLLVWSLFAVYGIFKFLELIISLFNK